MNEYEQIASYLYEYAKITKVYMHVPDLKP